MSASEIVALSSETNSDGKSPGVEPAAGGPRKRTPKATSGTAR